MARNFKSTNKSSAGKRFYYRTLWSTEGHPENGGLGHFSVMNYHFAERLHYGVIDHQNNAVIPNEDFLVQVGDGRLFDFVADSFSLAKLNCLAARQTNQISNTGLFKDGLQIMSSYQNPKIKHGKYLDDIFQFYNETHIPLNGTNSITSYEAYVKKFFNFFFNQNTINTLTLTKWIASNRSSMLDTGLAFSFYDIPYDEDQRKIKEVIDTIDYQYLKNLSLNMSFNIMNYNPNILVYDLNGPAGESIRGSYGLNNLDSIFDNRFIKTYTLDNDIIYNKLNIYYNKYAQKNSLNRVVSVQGCKTTSEYYSLSPVEISRRPHSDNQELHMYTMLRNKEEGSPFSQQKLDEIYKKAIFFMKKVDKPSGISYINNMFRDQVWNKDNGFHDLKAKLAGTTQTGTQRQQTGGGPSSGGSSY